MKTLEERIARLEAALGVDDDDGAPLMKDRVSALEALAAKAACWIDRNEDNAKRFAEDYRKTYVEVDWKWR